MLQTAQTQTEPKTLQMEERECSQCSRSFKVLTTSPQAFCSQTCQMESPVKSPKPKKKRPWESLERDKLLYGSGVKVKPTLPHVPHDLKPVRVEKSIESIPLNIEIKEDEVLVNDEPIEVSEPVPTIKEQALKPMTETDVEQRWTKYVAHAKTYVKGMNQGRMKIAELAIEACDIQWGGGNHWKKFEGVYTIKRFAAEIGVHSKTLSEWCAIKRLVKDKLPEGLFVENNYMAAQRTRQRIDRKTKPKKVAEVYQEELDREGPAYYFYQALKRLRTTRHLVTKRLDLSEVSKEEIAAMRDACREIDTVLTDFLDKN